MSKYTIYRWDSFLYGKSTTPKPIIYIKPDKQLLEFAKANDNAVMIKVSGSNTIYDGKNIPGIFSKSANPPTCMENYFKATELYTIQLFSNWYGYPHPNTLGEIEIFGEKTITPEEEKKPEQQKSVKLNGKTLHILQDNPPPNSGLCELELIGISCGILIILVGLTIYYKCKK